MVLGKHEEAKDGCPSHIHDESEGREPVGMKDVPSAYQIPQHRTRGSSQHDYNRYNPPVVKRVGWLGGVPYPDEIEEQSNQQDVHQRKPSRYNKKIHRVGVVVVVGVVGVGGGVVVDGAVVVAAVFLLADVGLFVNAVAEQNLEIRPNMRAELI